MSENEDEEHKPLVMSCDHVMNGEKEAVIQKDDEDYDMLCDACSGLLYNHKEDLDSWLNTEAGRKIHLVCLNCLRRSLTWNKGRVSLDVLYRENIDGMKCEHCQKSHSDDILYMNPSCHNKGVLTVLSEQKGVGYVDLLCFMCGKPIASLAVSHSQFRGKAAQTITHLQGCHEHQWGTECVFHRRDGSIHVQCKRCNRDLLTRVVLMRGTKRSS